MTACGAAAKKDTYVVGICQLVQHDALDAATKGFQDALTEALGDKVKFEVQNASGDSVNCTTIINGFVSSKVDLIMEVLIRGTFLEGLTLAIRSFFLYFVQLRIAKVNLPR